MKKQLPFFQNQFINFTTKYNRFSKLILTVMLVVSFSTLTFSQTVIDCAAGPVNTTYCYVDNDTTQFVFTNTDGFPLNVFFNAGEVENNFDELIILDTDGVTNLNAGTPYGNNGNLTGLSFQSSGDTITVMIDSDSVISCATNAFTPWDFDVWCQTCLNPTVAFGTDGDCTDGSNFSVIVDITDMGSATELTITDDQGTAPLSVTSNGSYTYGDYPATVDVVLNVNDSNDSNCFINSNTISCLSGGPGSLFVNAGEDIELECDGDGCTDITASFLGTFESLTENYIVDPITYDPPFAFDGLANSINTNVDDAWSNVEDLPFDFCFFENIETQFQVGSNGGVRFDVDPSDDYNGWSFDENIPNNDNETLAEVNVFTPVHDIDPSVNGSNEIAWEILGTFPNRVLVVSYYQVPYFSCNELLATHMVVFYEFSNVIEVYIQEKPTCSSWNDGNTVLGIQNDDGTIAYVPPGRNTSDSPWQATEEAWSFTPAGEQTYVFEWLDADGNFISSDPTINVCPDGEETYTAQITYTNCNGDEVVLTDEVTVSLIETFAVELGEDQELCDAESYDITADIIDGNPEDAIFEWSTGGDTQTITVTESGEYSVDVTIDGCTITKTINLEFLESPLFELGNDFTTCFSSPVFLDATPSNVDPLESLYEWSYNGVVIPGEISATIEAIAHGTYSVTVSSVICENTDSIIITPTEFDINLGDNIETCFDEGAIILDATPSQGADIAIYNWFIDGELIDGENSSTIIVANYGVYTASVVLGGDCVENDSVTIFGRQDLPVSLGENIMSCKDVPVSVSAITNENDASFQWWYDNEDNIIEGQTGSSLDIPRDSQDHFIPGTYGVTITVGGCTGSDSIDVSLYDNADCVISQGLSPGNGDGLNDRLDLSFLDDRSGIASLKVFNRLGTLVYDRTSYRKEWKGQSNANKILPSGTYYYIINLKNEDPVFGNEASGWVYLNREEN